MLLPLRSSGSKLVTIAALSLLMIGLVAPSLAHAQAASCLCTISSPGLASLASETQRSEARSTCEGAPLRGTFDPSVFSCSISRACEPVFASTLNDHLRGQPVTASCAPGSGSAGSTAPTPAPSGSTAPPTTPDAGPPLAAPSAGPPLAPSAGPPLAPAATTPASEEAVPGAGEPGTPINRPFVPIVPNPAVPIPGVVFTPATEQDGQVSIPYLAQYISGIYRLSVGLGAILAAVMIVYGGFMYMLSASVPGVETGKKIIQDAVIGLVVLLSSFLILKTINPKLVEMAPLLVQRVQAEVPVRQSGEFTGNPSATGFDADDGGGGCGGGASGRTQTIEGVSFTVLPLRKEYKQGSAPWGNISYGPNLTNNESLLPCKGDGRGGDGFHQPVVNGCTQTFKNGGCGATATATILAFYGHQVTNPGDAALASHIKVWNGDQLVDLSAHPNGQTLSQLLQARVGSHLFDPIDAGRLIVSQGHGGRGGSAFTSELPTIEGFEKRSIRGSAAVAQEIRAGHPVVIYCAHCNLKFRNMSDPDHRGGQHYMVVHGVSEDSQWFLIQDSGGGGRAGGKFIAAREVDNGTQPTHPSERSTSYTVYTPTTATAARPCTTSNDGGGSAAAPGGSSSAPSSVSTSGETSHFTYTYRPAGASSDPGWGDSSAAILPTRLLTAYGARATSRPRARVYIYLHGLNSTGATVERALSSGSLHSFEQILQQSAGSRNVIILAPRYLSNVGTRFFNAFDLGEFYRTSITALEGRIPGFQASDIQDVVVSGHSSATCSGPGSPVLRQAITASFSPARLRGIVAYDGCLGDTVKPSTFNLPDGVSMYLNPDLGSAGMGIHRNGNGSGLAERYKTTRTAWDLRRIACPGNVSNLCPMGEPGPVEPSAPSYDQRRCNACYGKIEGGREVISYETAYGHDASVPKMTELMFNAFYAR